MRVQGNVSPNVFSIEPYEPVPGKVEVRLCENITPYERTDPMTEKIINGFEYDEYVFILDDVPSIAHTIQSNFEDWLTTGRTLEVSPQATLYVTAKSTAIDEYTEELIEEGLL